MDFITKGGLDIKKTFAITSAVMLVFLTLSSAVASDQQKQEEKRIQTCQAYFEKNIENSLYLSDEEKEEVSGEITELIHSQKSVHPVVFEKKFEQVKMDLENAHQLADENEAKIAQEKYVELVALVDKIKKEESEQFEDKDMIESAQPEITDALALSSEVRVDPIDTALQNLNTIYTTLEENQQIIKQSFTDVNKERKSLTDLSKKDHVLSSDKKDIERVVKESQSLEKDYRVNDDVVAGLDKLKSLNTSVQEHRKEWQTDEKDHKKSLQKLLSSAATVKAMSYLTSTDKKNLNQSINNAKASLKANSYKLGSMGQSQESLSKAISTAKEHHNAGVKKSKAAAAAKKKAAAEKQAAQNSNGTWDEVDATSDSYNNTNQDQWAVEDGYTWATRKGHCRRIHPGEALPSGYHWQR